MPALNEEQNLEAAVRMAQQVVPPFFDDYEILIFNDGSTDKTGAIADRLAASDPRIKVTHHATPKNLGGVYKAGVQQATKQFVIMIPGDNENGSETVTRIFELAGEADIIVPFVANTEVRPFKRRVISRAFVMLTNLVSGCHLRYYNGTVLHKTAIIRECRIQTDGFGYQAEALVKLIRQGRTYREVGVDLARRPEGASKALRLDNLIKVGRFLSSLAFNR